MPFTDAEDARLFDNEALQQAIKGGPNLLSIYQTRLLLDIKYLLVDLVTLIQTSPVHGFFDHDH